MLRTADGMVTGLTKSTVANIQASSGIALGRMLANQARIRPDKVAVAHPEGTLTYRELNQRANQVAHGLLERGLSAGDRIAVLSENRWEYVVLLYAAAKIGATIAAPNWRQTAREVADCVELVQPAVFVVSDQLADLGEKVSRELGGQVPKRTIAFDDSPGLGDELFEALFDQRTDEVVSAVDPESIMTILYTSGTTGPSKGAAISHRALVARAGMMAAELRLSAQDAFLGWAPMFHMVTTDYMFITHLLGGTFVVIPGFQVESIVDALCTYKVGWFVLMPGTVDPIIQNLVATSRKPIGITAVGAMADLIPPAKLAELTRLLDCPFFNSFGSTETGTIPSAGSLLEAGLTPVDFGKEQTAFCDARLVAAGGREAAPGQEGELLLRSPTMFSGYWNDEETNSTVFIDGWYHTGDVFTRSADGRLHFAGRKKYMIKSGGENIYPAEIERILLSHEDVEEAVVTRIGDERWGEVPRAFVALRPGASLSKQDLIDFCDGKLARYMHPKWIRFLPEAEFPRNPTGKVLRAELERIPLGEE